MFDWGKLSLQVRGSSLSKKYLFSGDFTSTAPCKYLRTSCNTNYRTGIFSGTIACVSSSSSSGTSSAITPASCCPTNGLWTSWSSWSSCSDICGSCGTQTRTRSCDPAPYGCPCDSSSSSEFQSCNANPCPYPKKTCCVGNPKVVGASMLVRDRFLYGFFL